MVWAKMGGSAVADPASIEAVGALASPQGASVSLTTDRRWWQ